MRPAPHLICDELAGPENARQRPAQVVWSKLASLDLSSSSHEKHGSINELVMNKSGNIKAAVLKRRRPPASARTTSPCR
jgi:hypothetical protein